MWSAVLRMICPSNDLIMYTCVGLGFFAFSVFYLNYFIKMFELITRIHEVFLFFCGVVYNRMLSLVDKEKRNSELSEVEH